MKFFIVAAALLVASVSGQSLDILKLSKEPLVNSLDKFDRPLVSGQRLLGHPLERSLTYGENIEVPAYLRDEILDVNVLQFEDVVSHPLFRVYLNLPLFRQFWIYPMFQRYVCSVYFQRFWYLPSFQQYFANPVLFYKYIYPMVTLFKTDVSSNYGDYLIGQRNTFPYNYNYIGQQQQFGDLVVPSIYGTNTGDYDQTYRINYLVNRIQNHLITQQQPQLVRDIYTPEETLPGVQTVGQIVDRLPIVDAEPANDEILPVVNNILPEQYPRIRPFNPLVARMLQGYDYNRVLPYFYRF